MPSRRGDEFCPVFGHVRQPEAPAITRSSFANNYSINA